MGVRVQGLFRVQGSGFRVQGPEFRFKIGVSHVLSVVKCLGLSHYFCYNKVTGRLGLSHDFCKVRSRSRLLAIRGDRGSNNSWF